MRAALGGSGQPSSSPRLRVISRQGTARPGPRHPCGRMVAWQAAAEAFSCSLVLLVRTLKLPFQTLSLLSNHATRAIPRPRMSSRSVDSLIHKCNLISPPVGLTPKRVTNPSYTRIEAISCRLDPADLASLPVPSLVLSRVAPFYLP